jgi:hypothetical protein
MRFPRGWRSCAFLRALLQAYSHGAKRDHYYGRGSPVRPVLFETACGNCRPDYRPTLHVEEAGGSYPFHVG